MDTDAGQVTVEENGEISTHALASPKAFEAISRVWLRAGWDSKYVYTFSWMGRPIIQLPEDLVRLQEVIVSVAPDVIVETGVAHGGGLVFYASLLKAMERQGRVIGIDIEIRPHNRRSIESHWLSPMITLVEGSSTEAHVVEKVRSLVRPDERVLVILDSNHTRPHVRAELEAYAPLVPVGSYLVVTDGIMRDLVGAPRSQPDWGSDNPFEAARDFIATHPEFVCDQPAWPFNESEFLRSNVTYWPGAWLRRVR